MSKDFGGFRELVNADERVRQRLRQGEDPVAVAKEKGYQITREDVAAALKDKDLELTEFELELVSGGADTQNKANLYQTPDTTINQTQIQTTQIQGTKLPSTGF